MNLIRTSPSVAAEPPIAETVAAAAPARTATGWSARDRPLRRLLASADAAGLLVGALVLGVIATQGSPGEVVLLTVLTIPVWLVLFATYGLYRRDYTLLGHTTVDDIPPLFHAMLVGCPLLWLYFRILPGDQHFGKILTFGIAAAICVLVFRIVARMAGARLLPPDRALLVGDATAMGVLAQHLAAQPHRSIESVGILGEPAAEELAFESPPVLGSLRDFDLEHVAAELGIDRVIVSHDLVAGPGLVDLVRRCRQLSIKVSVLPQVSEAMGSSTEIDDIGGLTLIALSPPVLSPAARTAKRCMDVAGALLGLVVTAPLFVVIAVAIRLDSPGPVLFRQKRIGRRGRPFVVLKFRTMVADAESLRADLMEQSKDPGWLHLERDPRVTRVGAMLRQSSLDELPQLFNVLRGYMSLVGPRPLVPSEDANLVGWARRRLDLTPGMSGLWQTLGRTTIPFEEMLKLDYLYVTNWSLWGDVRLLLRTLPAVVTRRGVN